MLKLENECLAKYTTLKVGGIADVLSVPETENELIEEIRFCKKNNLNYKILGNGSNLVISDKRISDRVIYTKKACLELKNDDGLLFCGVSVMVQQLINYCIVNNKYAMEYLYSVPATLGGAIVQNAGRYRTHNLQVSDYLVKIKIYDANADADAVRFLSKEECGFRYRHSVFKEKRNYIVLGAYFSLPDQEAKVGEENKKARIALVDKYQDAKHHNCGSIFSKCNPIIIRFVKGLRFGGAMFSTKTRNWIINDGTATATDVLKLINFVVFLHKLFFCKVELEVEVWK